MPDAIREAQPPLQFLPQIYQPWVFGAIRACLPAWLRYKLHITEVQPRHLERLVDLYQQFQSGKTRMLIAFRHPTTDDPFTMAYLVWHLTPKAARAQGIRLSSPVHSHFVYDRGIPLWAGSLVSWLFPRLGGTPILRGKADRQGLKAVRELLLEGQFPVSIAPEGATNDHSELVAPLEPGVAQLGFWAAEDLMKASRPENMVIVPIGIRYQYLQPPWAKFEPLLSEMEQQCGLTKPSDAAGLLEDARADQIYGRMLTLGNYLLDIMEQFYQRYYDCPSGAATPSSGEAPLPNEQLATRLRCHLDRALKVAEHRLCIAPQGDFGDRCRRLEQAGWNRIFREDLATLAPVERGLADWTAMEASLTLWHMRLAERLANITGNYIIQKPSADRFAEILIILWRLINWVQGQKMQKLPDFGPRRVCLSIGESLSVTERLPQYQANRRAARQAVQTLTDDLQAKLKDLIADPADPK